MARFSFLKRKSKKNDNENEKEEKPLKPTKGIRRLFIKFSLYFPLGMYQRALSWSLTPQVVTNKSGVPYNSDGEEIGSEHTKLILIKEKSFNLRFSYFFIRTFLQSFGLAIIFTAPITLPWFFNVVIPFSINLLPFGLADFVFMVVESISTLLKPLTVVAEIIMNISRIFGTYNPIFFYGTALVIFEIFGLVNVQSNLGSINTTTTVDVLAITYQDKFTWLSPFIVPFLIMVMFIISSFFIIRRAKSILFEILSEKHEKKKIEKIKRTLLSYYLENGYSTVEYKKNRISESPKLRILSKIIFWGPLIAILIPIGLAFLLILF